MTYRKKKIVILALVVVGLGIAAAYLIPYITSGEREASPISIPPPAESPDAVPAPGTAGEALGGEMKVLTLNLGHGRGTGPNQLLQGTAAIRAHLDDVAEMLKRVKPDVVALQEADGPSFWSGRFDHVAYLAGKGAFPYHARGEHVTGLGLSYGTAILSRLPLRDGLSVSFPPSPPTFTKGFVLCTIPWPGEEAASIDIVSVHLDFLRGRVRKKQVMEMIETLARRENPLIMMGDFNCAWTDKNPPLRALAEGLKLKAYQPEYPLRAGQPDPPPQAGSADGTGMVTFPTTHRRLDWVLISEELVFKRYEVLKDALSDHRPVLAVVVRN